MMVASTSVPRLMTKPMRVELPVDLAQQLPRQAELVDRPAKPPDRGVVGRLHIQRQAAKAAERQPIAHRLLGGGIGKSVPLLQKNDLEHRQRRIARRAHRPNHGSAKAKPRTPTSRTPARSGPEIPQPFHSRSPSPRRRKVGKGHGATSANHPL
jgi:hypothetical protein